MNSADMSPKIQLFLPLFSKASPQPQLLEAALLVVHLMASPLNAVERDACGILAGCYGIIDITIITADRRSPRRLAALAWSSGRVASKWP